MKNREKIAIMFLISMVISILCIGFGSVKIPNSFIYKIIINKILNKDIFFVSWRENLENIIINIRAPRIILAFITGAALSVVGIIMQTITKNALAEPYILGISSGASTGAVSVIVLGSYNKIFTILTVEQGAFLGAILSILIVFIISSNDFFNKNNLILIGVGVSAFFLACTNMIIYSSRNNSQLVTAMFWMTGSLSSASWECLVYPTIFLVVLLFGITVFSYELDILIAGNTAAKSLGVNITLVRVLLIFLSTLLISVVVSITGIIGFVGLIIPHISKKIVGYKHFALTIFSTFMGGTFLVVSDAVARTYFSPEEIPIGVITAFCGTPLFIFMIKKRSLGG